MSNATTARQAAGETTTKRRAALLRTADRLIPAIADLIIESGEVPSADLVTRTLVAYQAECEDFGAEYLARFGATLTGRSELHEMVQREILGTVYRRIRAAHAVPR